MADTKFKKPTEYTGTPDTAPSPPSISGTGPDMFDEVSPVLTSEETTAVAEIAAAAVPSEETVAAPAWDDIEAWSQSVLVGDEKAPSFFRVPNSLVPPFNQYYFTWANQNTLNLQVKTSMGWRLVPPEVCKRLGLSAYQLDARGFACVIDAVLMFIPRRPIDEYFAKKKNEDVRHIRDIPEVQEFLEAGRGGIKGVRTFAGEADEVQDELRFRIQRPVRVRVPRQVRYPSAEAGE